MNELRAAPCRFLPSASLEQASDFSERGLAGPREAVRLAVAGFAAVATAGVSANAGAASHVAALTIAR